MDRITSLHQFATPAVVALLWVPLLCQAQALPPRAFAHPDRIRYDSQCLTIDGKDVFIYSGAFHFFRCPKELWPDRFQKIKDAGFNTVETYVAWNWCERQMPAGLNDFSKVDLKDFDDWLGMAEKYGLNIIVRPGPYICAEWDTGGFPQWLLTKKPEQPLRSEVWLRSDDPVFLAWSKHWFDAVCPVIARHQITRKAPGQPGVILFQVENEYDYVHLPDGGKINQVKALARFARADGIDVPLITCWTHEVRGQADPLVRQVFDCCNFYPRWKVDHVLPDIEKLRADQPDAPLATTELQGGWFSKVGGKLSQDQDGISDAEIVNLTLFAIQNGETILNYYMLFGGTNPDDWAARAITTTYDYYAPIREWGGVGDRYRRIQGIGFMLREHGPRLIRSQPVQCDAAVAQNDVTVAERRASDGSRYFFVRTSQHKQPRAGTATVHETGGGPEIIFNYQLEPFGSKILYLPPGVNDPAEGEWLPRTAPTIARPTVLPPAVAITTAKMRSDPGPVHWKKLQPGETLAEAGVYDSHFVFYRAELSCATATNLLVQYPDGDAVLAQANGKPAPFAADQPMERGSVFEMPAGHNAVRLLYENAGHGNASSTMEHRCGIRSLSVSDDDPAGGNPVSLKAFGRPAGDTRQWWAPRLHDASWATVAIGETPAAQSDSMLTWYRMNFSLPPPQRGEWVPWRIHIVANGNGFVYLNGHPIGRYWNVGPQHDFFLPECWLHYGEGQANNITLNLRPGDNGASIQSVVVAPYSDFAENR